MLLLAGIGGFRPGVLVNIRYNQVALDLVLNPSTQERRLVATFTLYQNKQRTGIIRQDQSNV